MDRKWEGAPACLQVWSLKSQIFCNIFAILKSAYNNKLSNSMQILEKIRLEESEVEQTELARLIQTMPVIC